MFHKGAQRGSVAEPLTAPVYGVQPGSFLFVVPPGPRWPRHAPRHSQVGCYGYLRWSEFWRLAWPELRANKEFLREMEVFPVLDLCFP